MTRKVLLAVLVAVTGLILIAGCSEEEFDFDQKFFTLTVEPQEVTVEQGGSSTLYIKITPQNGFTGTVTLELVDQSGESPTGITLEPRQVHVAGEDPITTEGSIAVDENVSPGVYNLTLIASSESITKQASIKLTVLEGTTNPTPSFNIEVSPSEITITQGGSERLTLTANIDDNFAEFITLDLVDRETRETLNGLRIIPETIEINASINNTYELTLEADENIEPGTYEAFIVAITDTGASDEAPLAITVEPKVAILELNETSITVERGFDYFIKIKVNNYVGEMRLELLDETSAPPQNIKLDPTTIEVTSEKNEFNLTLSFLGELEADTYPLKIMAHDSTGNPIASADLNATVTACNVNSYTWEKVELPYEDLEINEFIYANGQFVGVASGGRIAISKDGYSWEIIGPIDGASNIEDIAYNGDFYLAIDDQGGVFRSEDLYSWELTSILQRMGGNFKNNITYGEGVFVHVSGEQGSYSAAISSDGTSWTSVYLYGPTSVNFSELTDVTYGNGRFVTTGFANIAIFDPITGEPLANYTGSFGHWSEDGINWKLAYTSTTEDGSGGIPYLMESITYGNGKFISVGMNAESWVGPGGGISADGDVWHEFGIPAEYAPENIYLKKVKFGSDQYMALRNDGIVLSTTDFSNWEIVYEGLPITSIGYGNCTWLLGGPGFIVVGK